MAGDRSVGAPAAPDEAVDGPLGRVTAPAEPGARAGRRAASGSPFDPPRRRFVEGEELGRGGMGRVVAATDLALDRTVAIKRMLSADEAVLVRFEREVRITARLQHPNIVSILDAGRDADGQPYYVMRKIEGAPLAAHVARAPSLRERLALLPNVLAAADATAHAHARGVIHRDLKPWNILLGPFGETSLIDWGVARELGEPAEPPPAGEPAHGLTRAGSAVGTPGFMAPEQARGEPADRRADVYALGATLYYLVTARVPDEGQGARGAPIPDGTPDELIAIMDKALATAPADRYADAGELAADLRRFSTGQLVAAHRYTPARRLLRFVRRHRVAVGIAGVAAAALVVVIAVAARNVLAERDAANLAREQANDRADSELVARAQALVATDPTMALATLKQLRVESPRWERAASVARAAIAGGADHGYRANGGISLEMSPDGRSLLSAGNDGRIVIRDLDARATRATLEVGTVTRAVWAGDDAIAYTAGTGVTVVELATGARRAIAATTSIADLARHGGALVARTEGEGEGVGVALELARDGTRVLAPRVAAWYVAPRVLVVSDGGDLRWVTGDRTHALGRRSSVYGGAITAASTAAGDRVAIDTLEGIVEWRLVGGVPVEAGRWHVGAAERRSHASLLVYLDGVPHVRDWSNTWWRLAGPDKEISGLPPAHHASPIPGGLALATRAGELALIDHDRTPIHHRAIDVVALASSARGGWLAAATVSGEIVTLELAAIRPRTWRTSASGILALDDRAAWLVDLDRVARLDRATGERVEVPAEPSSEVYVGSTGELFTLGNLTGELTIWSAGGARRFAEGGVARVAHLIGKDGEGDEIFALHTGGRITWRTLRAPAAVRELGSVAEASQLAVGSREGASFLAAVTPAGIERFELGTGARSALPMRGVRALAFDPRGVLWVTNEEGLWRWDGRAPPRVIVGVDRNAWIYTRAPGGALTWSAEGVFFQIDGEGRIERRVQTERFRGNPVVSFDRSTAAWRGRGGITVLDLATGVTRAYARDRLTTGLALDASGRSLAATSALGGREAIVSVWTVEPPPPSRWLLRPWLERATNAVLAPASVDVVEWR